MPWFGRYLPEASKWEWQASVPSEFQVQQREEGEQQQHQQQQGQGEGNFQAIDIPMQAWEGESAPHLEEEYGGSGASLSHASSTLQAPPPAPTAEPPLPHEAWVHGLEPTGWEYRPAGMFGFLQWCNGSVVREYPPVGARLQKSPSDPVWHVRADPLDPTSGLVEYGCSDGAGGWKWQPNIPPEFKAAAGGLATSKSGGGAVALLSAVAPAHEQEKPDLTFSMSNPMRRTN